MPFSYLYNDQKVKDMTNIQQEIWKDVVGYEGYYKVSNLGSVMGLARIVPRKRYGEIYLYPERERMLKFHINKKGYVITSLSKNDKEIKPQVHRLVAIAFIPNHDNKPQVNHKDGNKQNNHVDNLEWVTNQENIDHSWKTGLRLNEFLERSKIRSITVLDTETGIFYDNMKGASASLGKNEKYVSGHCSKKYQQFPISKYISNRFIKC